MVHYKGFNINVASQIDAHPLPEFSTANGLGANPTVACYIPVYPGAQIWIEYSVDRPQPPEAIYLFKLFISGHLITSWDCTSKQGFKGRTMYSLYSASQPNCTGSAIGQCSLRYSSQDVNSSPNTRDNCIEVRIHRVHARKRIRSALDIPAPKPLLVSPDAIKLCDNGYIDTCQPAKRYQYLLVDAQDEPYAIFRFYCRTVDYLERHGILNMRSSSPTSIATSTSQYFDIDTSPPKGLSPCHTRNKEDSQSPISRPTLPRSQSFSGSSFIKDSIEDLPSMVSRILQNSPSGSPTTKRASLGQDCLFNPTTEPLPSYLSPTKPSSPLLPQTEALRIKKRRSNLQPTPSIDDTIRTNELNVVTITEKSMAKTSKITENLRISSAASSRPVPRPLSPFTSSGFLRRLIGHGDISPAKADSEEGKTNKGWRGQKRYASDSACEHLLTQRSNSRLGIFGWKSAA